MLHEIAADLDPLRLLEEMRAVRAYLAALANGEIPPPKTADAPDLAAFIAGLSSAWHAGGIRPTFSIEAKPLYLRSLESVRKVYEGLQSLRSIRRIEARRRNASALSVRFSKSLASRRQRLSHARVRSTTQRMGSTTKPLAWSDRLTISIARCGRCFATASANFVPW